MTFTVYYVRDVVANVRISLRYCGLERATEEAEYLSRVLHTPFVAETEEYTTSTKKGGGQ